MEKNRKKSKFHRLEFITSGNIDQHSHEIESALHLPPNNISILFSDELINSFKAKLDQALADSINVTEKFIQNWMRFHDHENKHVTAYFEKSHKDIHALADDTIRKLQEKHDELIKQYNNEVGSARNKIMNTKGYNEAILLAEFKKSIIFAIQQSPLTPNSHALDNCGDCNLDTIHKKIADIIKSAKHKKQIVHDIHRHLKQYTKHDALIFDDKHTISFTMSAYKMELAAIDAQQSAQATLKSINTKLEESVHFFENEVFLKDHFEKLRNYSSQTLTNLSRRSQ